MRKLALLLAAAGFLAMPGAAHAAPIDPPTPGLNCREAIWQYAVNFPGLGGLSNFQVSPDPIDLAANGNVVAQVPSPRGVILFARDVGTSEVSSAVVTYSETLQDFLQNGLDLQGFGPLHINVWIDRGGDEANGGGPFTFDQRGVLTGLDDEVYGTFTQTGPGQYNGSTPFLPFWGSSATNLTQVAQEVGASTRIWFWIGVDLSSPGQAIGMVSSLNGSPACRLDRAA
ncbi:MAG TPA: hypothetical protein VKY90_01150 [Candidatus Dormibacteraeota bacterium]|nr:hypothetical protein [Candidatus Dormibacteraeota bacterium]